MIVAITHATGVKLAEVGFLLILIAGVWLVASEIVALGAAKWHEFRIIVATDWGSSDSQRQMSSAESLTDSPRSAFRRSHTLPV